MVPGAAYVSPYTQDQIAVRLYYTDWQAKKIITIPVDDMLREGWRFDGLSEDAQDKLEQSQNRLKVLECFKQAMRVERLIGGCVIFMGVVDGTTEAATPLNIEGVQAGGLKFLNVIPRNQIAPKAVCMDPLDEHYGRPETYMIRGKEIHRTRLIIFAGDPLLPMPDATLTPTMYTRNDGFGVSKLLPIYDDLVRATGTRQAAYQMAQRASVFLAQMDLMDLQGTKQGEAAIAKMQEIVNQLNLFRGAVVDRQTGDGDTISTLATQFGSVPELVMSFLQVLSAASDIPATRFLGQAPGGLNATGDSDLENYYGRLASDQNLTLKPQLMQLLEVEGRSVLGTEFRSLKVDVQFPPLWSMSELEQSQIRTADTTNIIAMVTAGLLGDEPALRELAERDVLLIDVDASDLGTPTSAADPAGQLDAVTSALAGTQGPGGPKETDDEPEGNGQRQTEEV